MLYYFIFILITNHFTHFYTQFIRENIRHMSYSKKIKLRTQEK